MNPRVRVRASASRRRWTPAPCKPQYHLVAISPPTLPPRNPRTNPTQNPTTAAQDGQNASRRGRRRRGGRRDAAPPVDGLLQRPAPARRAGAAAVGARPVQRRGAAAGARHRAARRPAQEQLSLLIPRNPRPRHRHLRRRPRRGAPDLGSKNPMLYLEFPQGRTKLLGTHVYPKNKYFTLQMTRSAKGVVREDVFESLIRRVILWRRFSWQ